MPDQSYAATEHALLEEITRPLERLPEDPLELVEADFPTAMRGYDKAAVDDYVRETSALVAELQAVRTPESAVRRALVRAGGQISGVLRRAHEIAGEITASSRSEAEDRLERARTEADEIMDAAERRVHDLDADTDRIWLDRQRIMADVEDLSNQLLDLARQAGARFPDEAEQGPYDDERGERPPSADGRERGDVEAESEPEAGAGGPDADAGDQSATWTPVESAAWERWADHDAPADGGAADAERDEATEPGDSEPGEPSGEAGTALTDRAETLPLAAPERLDLSEPPEVEPRSARLSHRHGSGDGDGDAEPGSAGAIPPMSDAANRPRRP
jgi:DivIVA domain-containing protein